MACIVPVADADLTGVWIFGGVLALGVATLFLSQQLLGRLERNGRTSRPVRQAVTLALFLATLVACVITLPEPFADQRGDLLQFLGIVLSAALALSSTTLLGNLLAGFMVRSVRRLRVGDFLEVGEHFGRITERGLLFTEIQSVHSNLIEIPNLYLAQHPVKLLREQGTIVSADVSLGYDVPHAAVSEALLRAGKLSELTEAFVLVVELGDFSVTYRVGGMLHDVKSVVSANSRLRTNMLDELHGAGIEIVSPTFMNTRALEVSRRIAPRAERARDSAHDGREQPAVEEIAFEEAEKAETLEELREQVRALERRRKEQLSEQKVAEDGQAEAIGASVKKLEIRMERLKAVIHARENHEDE